MSEIPEIDYQRYKKDFKYATLDIIRVVNNRAIEGEKNRSIEIDKLEKAVISQGYDPEEIKFPVTWTMEHNDIEVRTTFVFGQEPHSLERFTIDMSYEDFNNLPTFTMEGWE